MIALLCCDWAVCTIPLLTVLTRHDAGATPTCLLTDGKATFVCVTVCAGPLIRTPPHDGRLPARWRAILLYLRTVEWIFEPVLWLIFWTCKSEKQAITPYSGALIADFSRSDQALRQATKGEGQIVEYSRRPDVLLPCQ